MRTQKIRSFRIISGIFLSALLLSFSSLALGDELVLFSEPGKQVENYNELVSKIQKGDVLVFSDGSKFEAISILSKPGSGKTTLVVEIPGNRALRIPLKSGIYGRTPYTKYISTYLDDARSLIELNIPVVGIYLTESRRDEYVVVDKLDIKFTYREFIRKVKTLESEDFDTFMQSLDEQDRKIFESLVEFAGKTWHLKKIGDFHMSQLGWTGEKWVIFDFADGSRRFETPTDMSVFDDNWKLPKPIRAKITAMVHGLRMQECASQLREYFHSFKENNIKKAGAPSRHNPNDWFNETMHAQTFYQKHGYHVPESMITGHIIESILPAAIIDNDRAVKKSAVEALLRLKEDMPSEAKNLNSSLFQAYNVLKRNLVKLDGSLGIEKNRLKELSSWLDQHAKQFILDDMAKEACR